mmetsp:Transcript_4464/g.8168  ORF Transcript_4464/g.8168 Transcript_4464/m.8168 type:complete len:91 (-) Transcript_4464:1060-1332(-)
MIHSFRLKNTMWMWSGFVETCVSSMEHLELQESGHSCIRGDIGLPSKHLKAGQSHGTARILPVPITPSSQQVDKVEASIHTFYRGQLFGD